MVHPKSYSDEVSQGAKGSVIKLILQKKYPKNPRLDPQKRKGVFEPVSIAGVLVLKIAILRVQKQNKHCHQPQYLLTNTRYPQANLSKSRTELSHKKQKHNSSWSSIQ